MQTLTVGQANAIDDAVREISDIIAGELGEFEIDWESQSWAKDKIRRVLLTVVVRYFEETARVEMTVGPSGEIMMSDTPKARRGDPSTSKRASLENLPRRQNQHRRIIEFLAVEPLSRWTAEQVSVYVEIRLNSVSTRMTELERAGWVDVEDRDSKRQTYKISTRGLLRYSLGRQQEAEKT